MEQAQLKRRKTFKWLWLLFPVAILVVVVYLYPWSPEIIVKYPADGQTVACKKIELDIATKPAKAEILINGESSSTVSLSEGKNDIVISAKHPKRRLASTKSMTVYYKLPAPKITIYSPANDTVLAEPSVLVSGCLNDYGIDVSIRNERLKEASEVRTFDNLSFSDTVPLVLGKNDIEIIARNKAGEKISRLAVIYRPMVELTINDPKDGYTVKHKRINITGHATPGSIINIGKDKAVVSDKGEFRIPHAIKIGVNNISVVATKLGYEAVSKEFALTWEESESEYKNSSVRGPMMANNINKWIGRRVHYEGLVTSYTIDNSGTWILLDAYNYDPTYSGESPLPINIEIADRLNDLDGDYYMDIWGEVVGTYLYPSLRMKVPRIKAKYYWYTDGAEY